MANMIFDDIEDTGLGNTDPRLVRKMEALSDYLESQGYEPVNITGGWRSPEHNAEVGGDPDSWHLYGRAVDFNVDDRVPDEVIEKYAQENNLYALKHNVKTGMHWHFNTIDDDEEPAAPVIPVDMWKLFGAMADEATLYRYTKEAESIRDDSVDYEKLYEAQHPENPYSNVLEAMYANFMDSAEDTGFWSMVGLAKSRLLHLGDLKHEGDLLTGSFEFTNKRGQYTVSQEDVQYVLDNVKDEKVQDFVLRQGIDGDEIRYLADRAHEDEVRRQQLEEWKAQNDSYIKAALVGFSGFAGNFADPMNFVPMARAVKGVSLLAKLGPRFVLNVSKAKILSSLAARRLVSSIANGTEASAMMTLDRAMHEISTGEQEDYATSSAIAFALGAALHMGGRLWRGRKGMSAGVRDALTDLDNAETRIYNNALGVASSDSVETGAARVLGTKNVDDIMSSIKNKVDDAVKKGESVDTDALQKELDKELADSGKKLTSENVGGDEGAKTISLDDVKNAMVDDDLAKTVQNRLNEKHSRTGEPLLENLEETRNYVLEQDFNTRSYRVGEKGEEVAPYMKQLHDPEKIKGMETPATPLIRREMEAGNVYIAKDPEAARTIIERMTGEKVDKDAAFHWIEDEGKAVILKDALSKEETNALRMKLLHKELLNAPRLRKEFNKILKQIMDKGLPLFYDKLPKDIQKQLNHLYYRTAQRILDRAGGDKKLKAPTLTKKEQTMGKTLLLGEDGKELNIYKPQDGIDYVKAYQDCKNSGDTKAFHAIDDASDDLIISEIARKTGIKVNKKTGAVSIGGITHSRRSMTNPLLYAQVDAIERAPVSEMEAIVKRASEKGAPLTPEELAEELAKKEKKDKAVRALKGEPIEEAKPEPTAAEKQTEAIMNLDEATKREAWENMPWYLRPLKPFVRLLSHCVEQGYFGTAFQSKSKTLRSLAPELWKDERGRVAAQIGAADAETIKEFLRRDVARYNEEYKDIRFKDLCETAGRYTAVRSRKARDAWDEIVVRAYDQIHGGNKGGNLDLSLLTEGQRKAVEAMHNYRQHQLEVFQNAGKQYGSPFKNLIDADWKPVDECFTRKTEPEKALAMLDFAGGDRKVLEDAYAKYVEAAAKREETKAWLLRKYKGEKVVTEDMVEKYIKKKAKAIAHEWAHCGMSTDELTEAFISQNKLGDLPNLRDRLPMDTSMRMELDFGGKKLTFSYDDHLRFYDVSQIMNQQDIRMSGEQALLLKFGDDKTLNKKLSQARAELDEAVAKGDMSRSDADKEMSRIKEGINELRGVRPREDTMTRLSALCRFFQGLSYFKNGANMGFAQWGETSGVMAYEGLHMFASAFDPLHKHIMRLKYGEGVFETLRDSVDYVWGRALEERVFGDEVGDAAVRKTLTGDSMIDRGLRGMNDLVQDLGKITSSINMLPKMTAAQEKNTRAQFFIDLGQWVKQGKVDKNGLFERTPFSEAKLHAAGLTKETFQEVVDDFAKYVPLNDSGVPEVGKLLEGLQKWHEESPLTFLKMKVLGKNADERAIQPGWRSGSRNLTASQNCFTRLATQFKAYTFRALNGQTMRTMTAADLDDLMATSLSCATNGLVNIARGYAMYATLNALGLKEQAEQYKQTYLNDEMLAKMAFIRSSIIGSPLSVGEDIYETITPGVATIRTTVDRDPTGKPKPEMEGPVRYNMKDTVGSAIMQMPAVREMEIPIQAALGAYNIYTGEGSKRDMMSIFRAVPIPKFFLMNAFYKKGAEMSGLPDKRKRHKKQTTE